MASPVVEEVSLLALPRPVTLPSSSSLDRAKRSQSDTTAVLETVRSSSPENLIAPSSSDSSEL
eukprot:CAMPEP_0185804494 /NCGR_PEP_ID=MMETSP1322-20130828/3285_1 /TAXON_ID=265543 /ORGANISM="Minutocellus polymorphus, Strain RCC2270" /LENGTH=62 /DNA_ID=CAMNT_0028500473 /DNA_START=36 /DNA_END=221 /DNA_ORIENTATION=+